MFKSNKWACTVMDLFLAMRSGIYLIAAPPTKREIKHGWDCLAEKYTWVLAKILCSKIFHFCFVLNYDSGGIFPSNAYFMNTLISLLMRDVID